MSVQEPRSGERLANGLLQDLQPSFGILRVWMTIHAFMFVTLVSGYRLVCITYCFQKYHMSQDKKPIVNKRAKVESEIDTK